MDLPSDGRFAHVLLGVAPMARGAVPPHCRRLQCLVMGGVLPGIREREVVWAPTIAARTPRSPPYSTVCDLVRVAPLWHSHARHAGHVAGWELVMDTHRAAESPVCGVDLQICGQCCWCGGCLGVEAAANARTTTNFGSRLRRAAQALLPILSLRVLVGWAGVVLLEHIDRAGEWRLHSLWSASRPGVHEHCSDVIVVSALLARVSIQTQACAVDLL